MSVLPPSPFAHGRLGGVAWALSVGIHAAVLGAWWLGHQPTEPPASVGQRRGALHVRLQSRADHAAPSPPTALTAPMAPTIAVAPEPKPSTLASHTRARPQPHPAPTTPAVVLAQAVSPSEAAASAPAAQPPAPTASTPAPPGATFANLFAPIISRPMGRGRWGAAPTPAAPPPPDPAIQRLQAIQAQREQWNLAVGRLQDHLNQTPLTESCEVQVYLSQSGGRVSCSHTPDQHLVEAMLTAFTTTPLIPDVRPEVCLHLHEHTIDWVSCSQASQKESGP